MNRRRQIHLSPDEQAAFFREQRKAALATLDQDGFPHVVAMNYLAKDGAFYMTSYGKAQKVVNVRRNPKVALMIETGNAYAELRGVMVRGRCEIIAAKTARTASAPSMISQRPRTMTPRSSAYALPVSIISATLGLRRTFTTFCALP